MNDIEESFSLQYDPTFFFHPFIPHQRRICIECHGAAIGQSHMSDLSKSGRFLDLTTTKYQVTQTTDHQNQAACGHPYPFPQSPDLAARSTLLLRFPAPGPLAVTV